MLLLAQLGMHVDVIQCKPQIDSEYMFAPASALHVPDEAGHHLDKVITWMAAGAHDPAAGSARCWEDNPAQGPGWEAAEHS